MGRILGGVVRRVLDANNEAVHRQNEGNDPLAWVFCLLRQISLSPEGTSQDPATTPLQTVSCRNPYDGGIGRRLEGGCLFVVVPNHTSAG